MAPTKPVAIKTGDSPKRVTPPSTANAPASRQSAEADRETEDLSKFTFATRWGHEKEPDLANFSRWASLYTNASPSIQATMIPEGVALARERRAAFKDLIRTQPKLALAETVPALVRNELPESILALLENRVTGQGNFIALGRTDPVNGLTVSRRAIINSQEYEAFVYGDRVSQQTRANVSLHGVALDGQLALSDSPLRVFEEGEPIPADKPLAAESCPISGQPTAPTKNGPRPNAVAAESGTHIYWMCHGKHVRAAADQVSAQETQFAFQSYAASGFRTALVIMVDFDDLPGASSPSDNVNATMNTVQQFLGNASYGDLHLSAFTVTPVLRMPRSSRAYSDGSNASGDSMLLNDARNAARNAGVDFNPDTFDFDMVAFASIGFPWSGQGYVGSKGAWIQGSFAGATVGHELGHNLGVWHANSWDSTESAISPNGIHTEYGNPFDVMGRTASSFPNDHYCANFKRLLGWLGDANISIVNGSGTFRVYAHDESSRIAGRTYALNIPVGIVVGDEIEDYWIEFRQLLATPFPDTDTGAIIQWGNDAGTQFGNRLLDMNFTTATKNDAPLAIGNTFSDPDRGLQVTTLAKGGSGADAYLDLQISLVTPPTVDIADAVDNTNLTWDTSSPGWTGQRSVTHDGVDAAASGAIRDSSETYIETTVNGPGALFFWWKVSSEENFDFLKFSVDGQTLANISGQVDWQQRGYELDAGAHTVRWTYTKDSGTAGGADRGWVDQVNFVSGEHGPFINAQPVAVTANLGDLAQLQIDAIGSAPLTFQWQKMSDTGQPVAITGATNSTLTLENVQDSDAGLYNCVVQNDVSSVTSSNALLTVTHFISLPEALDNTNVTWSTSGAVGWTGEQTVTYDGTDAAQSGPVTNGKDSSLNASIAGPGTLSFWWKVSSELDYDILSLYLDGDLIEYHSGEFDWTQKTITIPNGIHKVRWTYAKDANLSDGADAAWVDQVQFTPITGLPPHFIAQPGAQAVSVGGTALFTAQYTAGSPVFFTWMKDGVPLNPNRGYVGQDTDTLTITNVQPADAGAYTLSISNPSGSAQSVAAQLSIVSMSLADVLDQPTRAFVTGGFAQWTAETNSTHDGISAAQAGIITDEQFTWIETHIAGPANVTFWWKVSSEQDYDFLTFELDTLAMLNISGQVGWRQETIALDSGDHVLRWKYHKDLNTPGGLDTGWLDQIQVTPTAPSQPVITNLVVDSNGFNARVDSLPATGSLVIETSSNLTNWVPISTNQISGATFSITRPATGSDQFLRVRLQ